MKLQFTMNLDNSGLVVVGGEDVVGQLIIPRENEYEEKTYCVTEIAENAFEDNMNVSSVILPDSIRRIGRAAFAGCENLNEIVFPEFGFVEIEDFAFQHCGITEVNIPESVQEIGENAFCCQSLRKFKTQNSGIFWPNDEGNMLFRRKTVGHDFKMGIYKFQWSLVAVANAGIEGVASIPSFVTKIEAGAFAECKNLTEVIFHEKIADIANNAFAFCTGLTHVELPDAITELAPYVFTWCENLKTIVMPGVKKIGDNALSCCKSLERILFSDSISFIGDGAFGNCTSLTSVHIPESVFTIESFAFEDCTSLQTVIISDSEDGVEIGDKVFAGCTSLRKIIINDASLLEDAEIPEGVEIVKP